MSYQFSLAEQVQIREAMELCSGLSWNAEGSEYKSIGVADTNCVPLYQALSNLIEQRFQFFSLILLGICFAFCGYSHAEQATQPDEQVSGSKEELIKISLGNTIFKFPAPVYLDGQWIKHDAKGTELGFTIRAVELYKKFDSAAENNHDLHHEKFNITLTYSKISNEKRKEHEHAYIYDRKWREVYPDEKLGLLVYEPIQKLAAGWGSPTYYPLDKNYVAPDGFPFRISCNRLNYSPPPPPNECRFIYFLEGDIEVTFNFVQVEKNLKHWRELDQALRQTLHTYM
ncbi:MAG: hypothetical protein ACREXR_01840, partial [Gammaproteobacteria bacterium]